ncbi:MAG: protein translocase subunit SecD [Eubacteriales bacterium]|nr:protein translocase subunit SecD [Eubacteriales bacterium]
MKKKQSIAVLLILAVITVLLGFTVIQGWGDAHVGAMKNIRTGLDLSGGVSITYEATEAAPAQDAMNDTIWKLEQRVTNYSTEASVYQQGLNRINIEIPGVSNANEILADLGKPGSLYFTDESGNTVLEGTDIADAQGVARSNNTSGIREYVVELTMTSEGADKFYEATSANVGKRIAIVYDGSVVSNPTVQAAISGGKAEVNGMSSLEEAQRLASYIRIGSLSLELNEIYSNVVGASLGQEALATSIKAGIIGILLVILFMIIIFRVSGIAAGWALLLFTFMDLALMNAFDITLTLPGIAGLILTIGMAVDANVIIYTRVREELALGSGLNRAIRAGFHKAFSAIFDGQITTLIAAAVLYFLGTGSVQGFATTLAIGTVLSLFTALVISRWISYAFYGIGLRKEGMYGKTEHKKVFDFVGKRMIPMIIALVLVVSVPVGMVICNGQTGHIMNYSLDFVGGTATTVDFGQEMSLESLDNEVKPVVAEITGNNDIQFQKISGTTQVVIKTTELSLDNRTALDNALAEKFSVDASQITAENISSIISGEMRQNAIVAVIIAVACMLLYIFFRFRDIRFASSAVIALVHDIAIVIAFYVWFRASVGSTFIAVMLTILGYSINATIVIFDRVRENMSAMSQSSYKEIVNTSVTQTLTRSLYSNLTTLITVTVLYIMGVPSVRAFALPIIVGLLAGCFSSVFVTGPLWYMMKTANGRKDKGAVQNALAAETAAPAEKAAAPVEKAAHGVSEKKDTSRYQSTKPKRGRNRH